MMHIGPKPTLVTRKMAYFDDVGLPQQNSLKAVDNNRRVGPSSSS